MQSGSRIFICFVLLLGLLFASYYCMFQPMSQEIVRIKQDTQDKQEKLVSLRTVVEKKRDLPAEIDKLRKAITLFENRLPEEKEMDKVFREVSQIAEKNGLVTKSVRTLKTVLNTDYNEQPMRMTITGTWNGFYTFLRTVEGLDRLTQISEMSLNKDLKADGALTAEFTLTIFFDNSNRKQIAEAP